MKSRSLNKLFSSHETKKPPDVTAVNTNLKLQAHKFVWAGYQNKILDMDVTLSMKAFLSETV